MNIRFAETIRAHLKPAVCSLIGDIEVVERLPSTQIALMSRPTSSALWQVLVARNQTSGIGRQSRVWQAGDGQVSFSARGWTNAQASSIGLLSLLASLCVRDVLRSLGLSQVMLKWPNDVLVNHLKISGILISVVACTQNKFDIVLGIGLNRLHFPTQIDGKGLAAVSLSDILPNPPQQSVLIAELLNAWMMRLASIESEQGRADLIDEWQKNALWLGQTVTVILHDWQIAGVFRGLTSDGRLKLITSEGEQIFSAGEVQLRPHTQFN